MTTPHLLLPDAAHGHALPSGRELARVLRQVRKRQGQEVRAALNQGRAVPDLQARWLPFMVDTCAPLLLPTYLHGVKQLMTQLDRRKSIWDAFSVFLPQVVQAVRSLTMIFCRETLQTAQVEAEEAVEKTRQTLAEGLSEGEAHQSLSRRVKEIFDDPMRAFRISQTESSRAMHAGSLAAAQETGLAMTKSWLCSSDACEKCLALDGLQVPLDQPFTVLSKGGPYAVVQHPPLHPSCFCVTQMSVADYDVRR
jgi:uncharacterized protein YoaH (UPF0181 family)